LYGKLFGMPGSFGFSKGVQDRLSERGERTWTKEHALDFQVTSFFTAFFAFFLLSMTLRLILARWAVVPRLVVSGDRKAVRLGIMYERRENVLLRILGIKGQLEEKLGQTVDLYNIWVNSNSKTLFHSRSRDRLDTCRRETIWSPCSHSSSQQTCCDVNQTNHTNNPYP